MIVLRNEGSGAPDAERKLSSDIISMVRVSVTWFCERCHKFPERFLDVKREEHLNAKSFNIPESVSCW